jgi:hypothetical protein
MVTLRFDCGLDATCSDPAVLHDAGPSGAGMQNDRVTDCFDCA